MNQLIKNVRVFDGVKLTESTTVKIVGDKIAAIGKGIVALPNERVIEGNGKTLIPGLIDSHVHICSREDLDLLAKNGVTSAIDMASWPVKLTKRMKDEKNTTKIISAGIPFIGPAGPHSHFVTAEGAILKIIDEVDDAVTNRISDGSDFIKIVTEPKGHGGPSTAIVRAIIEASHAAGKLVVTHAAAYKSFEISIGSGADIVTHVPRDRAVDLKLAARTKFAIPTLVCSEIQANVPANKANGETLQASLDSVKNLKKAGTTIAAGSDSVAAQSHAPFVIQLGAALHRELELEVEAGFTPVEALQSATTVPGEIFHEFADRGQIKVGFKADLLLIDGNPTVDISTTKNILDVWIDGVQVK